MHKLLERQLRKAVLADGTPDLERLLAMVGSAYDEADRERRIKDHAFAEMQREVEELNRRVRDEAEARFNVVMQNVGEAVLIIDERGRIESFNMAAERMFGYHADEVIGRNVSMLMPPLYAQNHDDFLAAYLLTGQRKIIGTGREAEAQRENGETFPIELAVGEVRMGPNRRFIGVIRDITLRKQAERELRESEGRFRDIAGSASDWFWETDASHRLTFVSERIAAVLGVHPVEVLGHTFMELGMGDQPAVAAEHADDLANRRAFRDRMFHVGPSQGADSRIIRISGIPVFDEDREFLGYRGVGVDVTREVTAELRARKAQQQLADAIQSIGDGIAVYDGDDRLMICNPEYERVFANLNVMIVPGTPFEQVLHADPAAFDTEGLDFTEWAARRLKHHQAASGEPFLVRMTNGNWILHRECRMADGGVVGIRTDVTLIKQREQELETLKQRYQLILDSAGEGIIGLDTRGKITFANRRAGDLLGQDAGRMIGRCFHALVQARDGDGDRELVNSPVSNAYGFGVAGEVKAETFLRADSSSVPVDYYVAPIMEDGAVNGAVLVFHDATLRLQYERTLADSTRELERQVSERTQALSREVEIRARTEHALRDSRQRMKAITDSLFEGVIVVNPAGHVIFINPSAQRLLECHPETDLTGYPVDTIFTLAECGDFHHSPWRRVAADGGIVREDDVIFVTASGKKVTVAYACAALEDDSNNIRGAIISFRDTAALKQAQRDALQASRMASVGQLAAGIAHEINTPTQYIGDNLRFIGDSLTELVSVIKAGQAMAEDVVAQGAAEAVSRFAAACEAADLDYLLEEMPSAVQQSLDGVSQVGRIVLSMKEFSHPGSSSKSVTDINRAIETTLTVSHNAWKHVAEVVRDLDPSLPPLPCYAAELNQVFLNLIVNAAHAIEGAGKSEPGRITVSTAFENGEVVVSVADNGTGIPESLRDHIFEPFFTTKEVGKGTGQGLAICRDVVIVKHNGRIDVGGEEGQGAIFTVRLPVEAAKPAAEHV